MRRVRILVRRFNREQPLQRTDGQVDVSADLLLPCEFVQHRDVQAGKPVSAFTDPIVVPIFR